jgi:hypothetical protein
VVPSDHACEATRATAFLAPRARWLHENLLALALLAATALPAAANMLYKSVDANGTVMFSDTPPPEGTRILEERAMSAPATSYSWSAPGNNAPATNSLEEAFTLIDSDAALAQANARVDMAERALAQARGGGASRFEGLRLPQATQVSSVSNRTTWSSASAT